jgi:hypothetical protein
MSRWENISRYEALCAVRWMWFISEYASVHAWVWVVSSSYEHGQRMAAVKGMERTLYFTRYCSLNLCQKRLCSMHIQWNCCLKRDPQELLRRWISSYMCVRSNWVWITHGSGHVLQWIFRLKHARELWYKFVLHWWIHEFVPVSVIYYVEGCRNVHIRYAIYLGNSSAEYVLEYVVVTSEGLNWYYIYNSGNLWACRAYFNLFKCLFFALCFVVFFK